MFTGDICVDILDIDTGLLAKEETQAGRIQVGPRTEHLVLRKARKLQRYICHDIHRVGDQHENSIRGHFHCAGDNRLHNVDCCAGKVKP